MSKQEPIQIKVQNNQSSKSNLRSSALHTLDKLSNYEDLKKSASDLLGSKQKFKRFDAVRKLSRINEPVVLDMFDQALTIEQDRDIILEILSSPNWIAIGQSRPNLLAILTGHEDSYVRTKAGRILGALSDTSAYTELRQVLLNPKLNTAYRRSAFDALTLYSESDVFSVFEELMHSPAETELIKDVIIFLASMGTSVSEQLLIDFLEKTSDTVLRRETIWALARSSNQQALSFEHLIELFHSEHDMQNQKLILWLIGRTASPHEVATFLESLDDSIHSSFQREIIWLMNDRSGQLSSDSLMDIISKSMYPRIRYEALWAMARVLDKKDLPRLVQLQNLEKDIQIKDEISKLIASI